MNKFLTGAFAVFTASPAVAHVSEMPIHTHGHEAPAIAVGAILLAVLVWHLNKPLSEHRK